jgi:hypothetical protein
MASDDAARDLQFETAEAADAATGGTSCGVCQKPIKTLYYETGGQIVCPICRQQLAGSNVAGVDPGGFVRSILFGLGGAIAGAALYYAVIAATGYEIGLIAIVVGFMVGYMVRRGARGKGGRRYQIVALLLTYFAIGATYVPLVFRQMDKESKATADSATATTAATAATAERPVTASAATAPSAAEGESPTGMKVLLGFGALLALTLVMPVLAVFSGLPSSLISGLIIAFALQQAWKMNGAHALVFSGPHRLSSATEGPTAA